MSCPDDNQLAAFMEGGLSPAERTSLEGHIDTCGLCRGLLGDVVLGATRPDRVPRELREEATTLELEPPPGLLRPGQMVDHFRVVRAIGEGGMGRVYLARDTVLHRSVALKVIRPELATSSTVVRLFRREARATAKLSHPNIVTIHSVGEHRGIPYVALEHIKGDTLRERWRVDPPMPLSALRLVIGLAEGLAEAHRHGIVHKDLKPANILLAAGDRPKIADFGLADLARAERIDGTITHTDADTLFDTQASSGADGGTPSYMAPEQWRGEKATPATDVWALGVMTWELLARRRLFYGEGEVELAGQICGAEPIPPLPRELDVPPEIEVLVKRCLSRDFRLRPTAREVADSLGHLVSLCEAAQSIEALGDRESLATVASMLKMNAPRGRPISASDLPTRPRLEPAVDIADEAPRRRWGLVAIAAALVFGGALALVALSGAGDGEGPRAPNEERGEARSPGAKAAPAPTTSPVDPPPVGETPSPTSSAESSATAEPAPRRVVPRPPPNLLDRQF